MEYSVYQDDKPEAACAIEVESAKEAARIFTSQTPPEKFCYIVVRREDGTDSRFRTTELMGKSSLGEVRASVISDANSGVEPDLSSALKQRYSDAYTQAHSLSGIGVAFKMLGVFLGMVIILAGGIFAASQRQDGGLIAILGFGFGCMVGLPTYLLGILVAAQGQHQLAVLDTAVNSSRHLTDEDVAQVIAKRFYL